MNYLDLNQRIERLATLRREAKNGDILWKKVWNYIKQIGQDFKVVRYPTKQEKDKAWQNFQSQVEKIKEAQQEDHKKNQEQFKHRKAKSERLKSNIIDLANKACPPDHYYDTGSRVFSALFDMATFNLLKEQLDQKKFTLKDCSSQMQEVWGLFKSEKQQILREDKDMVFKRLSEVQKALDKSWEVVKAEGQEMYEQQKRVHAEKEMQWKTRMREKIGRMKDKKRRLEEVLSHKRNQQSDLKYKRDSAWSNDFRNKVSDWISQNEDEIDSIKDKIRDIEGAVYELEQKIN